MMVLMLFMMKTPVMSIGNNPGRSGLGNANDWREKDEIALRARLQQHDSLCRRSDYDRTGCGVIQILPGSCLILLRVIRRG